MHEDGAEAVVLGGLGLPGLAEVIGHNVPVPLIDNVLAEVRAAEAVAALGARKATLGSYALPGPIETTGVAPRLATLLQGRQPAEAAAPGGAQGTAG